MIEKLLRRWWIVSKILYVLAESPPPPKFQIDFFLLKLHLKIRFESHRPPAVGGLSASSVLEPSSQKLVPTEQETEAETAPGPVPASATTDTSHPSKPIPPSSRTQEQMLNDSANDSDPSEPEPEPRRSRRWSSTDSISSHSTIRNNLLDKIAQVAADNKSQEDFDKLQKMLYAYRNDMQKYPIAEILGYEQNVLEGKLVGCLKVKSLFIILMYLSLILYLSTQVHYLPFHVLVKRDLLLSSKGVYRDNIHCCVTFMVRKTFKEC